MIMPWCALLICLLSFLLVAEALRPLNVNIGTFAMEKFGGVGVLYLVFPAYDQGVADVRAMYGSNLNVTHRYIYKPWITTCNPEFLENVEDMVAEFYYETSGTADVAALVSPGCTEGSSTNLLATQWDILHISTGSDAGFRKSRKANPVWLTLATGSSTNMRDALVELLKLYQWKTLFTLLDTASNPVAQGILIAVQEAFRKMDQIHITARTVNATSETVEARQNLLADFRKSSRVMLYFGHSDYFRKVLLEASKANMTNGEYIYVGFQTLFHMGMCGNFSWRFGDESDEVARRAYRSVLVLGAVHLDNQTEVDRDDPFLLRSRELTKEKYNSTYGEPSPFMRTAYASMLMLGQVLSETYAEFPNYDFSRGKDLADRFLNRTFTNRIMDVTISPTGEIVVNLTLRATNPSSGKLEVVKIWDGLRHLYLDVAPIAWPNGESPPLDVPYCGYLGKAPACAPGFQFGAVVGAIVGVLAGLAVCLVTALYCIRRRTARALLNDRSWIISDVALARGQASQSSVAKSQTNQKRVYEGIPIWTKSIYRASVDANTFEMLTKEFDYELQTVVLEVRGCNQPNVNRFFGIYFASLGDGRHSLNAVTALCQRGSICDLFQARDVDWDFRISFLTNLLEGMMYIHSGRLRFHGRLTIRKCLLDRYFTLKIADYGHAHIEQKIERWIRARHFEPSKTATAVGKPAFRLPDEPRESDVRNVGLLVTEISTASVLNIEDLASGSRGFVLEVIDRAFATVIEGKKSLKTRLEAALPKLAELIQRCLEIDPRLRPSMIAIRTEVNTIFQLKRTKATVVEKTINRLSVYSERLESDVAARTTELMLEREKSDILLEQLMPPMLVDLLRQGGLVPAEMFSAITLFFSGIVGFATYASQHSPLTILKTVANIFRILDNCIAKFNVYKVETIGDSYMVASGVPERYEHHAEEIVTMACLMHRIYYGSDYPSFDLGFQAGAHSGNPVGFLCEEEQNYAASPISGSVAAGVVGLNRPRYCLFGDTVNTASRMCSHGESGKIHISSQTMASIVKDLPDAEVTLRGTISVKGKGEMVTYWIVPKKPGQP